MAIGAFQAIVQKIISIFLAIVAMLTAGKYITGQNSKTEPTIEIESVSTTIGKTICIPVKINNNPGFLALALNITYDSEVMRLTKVQNGDTFNEYSFVAPKNKKSGCTASWYITDLPDTISDGELMFLHFTVDETCPAGSYPVTVSCPDDGSIIDGNMNPFSFPEATGYVNIR